MLDAFAHHVGRCWKRKKCWMKFLNWIKNIIQHSNVGMMLDVCCIRLPTTSNISIQHVLFEHESNVAFSNSCFECVFIAVVNYYKGDNKFSDNNEYSDSEQIPVKKVKVTKWKTKLHKWSELRRGREMVRSLRRASHFLVLPCLRGTSSSCPISSKTKCTSKHLRPLSITAQTKRLEMNERVNVGSNMLDNGVAIRPTCWTMV